MPSADAGRDGGGTEIESEISRLQTTTHATQSRYTRHTHRLLPYTAAGVGSCREELGDVATLFREPVGQASRPGQVAISYSDS